uniref:Odorant-binding protein 4 n=2 Tax=Galleria mellonella TaxID=7137 RepID=A0A5C0E485_GALME|nr:odorant-binding protein 4 [Galleria mellonella]
MSTVLKLVLCAFIFIRFFVQGDPIDELKQTYMNIVKECLTKYPVTSEEMEHMKNGTLSKSGQANCLLACAYRKTGMMDEAGMLSLEGVNKATGMYFSNNPEKMKKAEEFIEACKGVNEEEVNDDGDKGCTRAALIFRCTIEKAPGFDLI